MKSGKTSVFSIYDAETGQSYWLEKGQSRGSLSVVEYHADAHILQVSWYGRSYGLTAQTASDVPREVLHSQSQAAQLSAFNEKLIRIHKNLIKATVSKESGRLVKDHRAQEKFRRFLQTNPSPPQVSDFLFPEMEEHIDLTEYLELDFPKGVLSRSSQDTPGWDVKDDVTHDDIVKLLASSPAQGQLNTIKKDRP